MHKGARDGGAIDHKDELGCNFRAKYIYYILYLLIDSNMNGSRELVIIATMSILLTIISGLLIQPAQAMFCAANISSNPSDADVYIDGAYKGKTTYFHYVGNPFTFNLVVKKEGYQTWSQVINVGEEVKEVKVDLVALEAPPPPKGAATVTTTITTTVTTASPTTVTRTITSTPAVSTTPATTNATTTATITSATTSTVTPQPM